jgi:hypothetical protein
MVIAARPTVGQPVAGHGVGVRSGAGVGDAVGEGEAVGKEDATVGIIVIGVGLGETRDDPAGSGVP